MGLETDVSGLKSLNANWPPVSDPRAQGADHIRNLKKALQLAFPNINTTTISDAQLTAIAGFIGDPTKGRFTVPVAVLGASDTSDTGSHYVEFQTRGKKSWILGIQPTITGDSLVVIRYNADGSFSSQPLAINADGSVSVPQVADWSKPQPVPANQADARYVGRAMGNQGYPALQAGVNRSSGNPWLSYNDGNGVKFAMAQQAGDYATTAQLNSVAGAKVNRGGDTMTGGLTVNSASGVKVNNGYFYSYGTWGGSLGNSGDIPWAGQFVSRYSDGYAGSSRFCHRTLVGSYEFASIQVTGVDSSFHELQFRANDDRLYTNSGKVFALTTEIPTDIYSGTAFNNDFFTNDARVINLPYNKRCQTFTVSAGSGTRVNFPQGFSGAPTSISIMPTVHTDVWFTDMDSGGFTFWNANSWTGAITVTVFGPR